MAKVREYNSWIKNILDLDEKTRSKWVKKVIQETRNAGRKDLADFLESKDCEIIGFAPFYEYVRCKNDPRGDDSQIERPFNHSIATHALFCWHKKLKMFVIAGPCLEWNKSAFGIEVIGGTN